MKVTRSQWILVTATCLIVAASAAQSGADLPPGADGNNWVPISDTAGILLTNPAGIPGAMRFQPLQGFNVETIVAGRGPGILMVKHGGAWLRVDLELPPARLRNVFIALLIEEGITLDELFAQIGGKRRWVKALHGWQVRAAAAVNHVSAEAQIERARRQAAWGLGQALGAEAGGKV